MERLQLLPDWPARMTSGVAALYMGISEGSFLARFAATGVKEGANRLWARRQLDDMIARQFDLTQDAASGGEESLFDRLTREGKL